MNKVMLANIDYLRHMTDEGNQLQQGMRQAGWHLSGKGFDGLQDCRHILSLRKPDVVFVHDRRDWDSRLMGSFRRDIAFTHLEALHGVPVRLGVVKDAGSMIEYHRRFAEDIKATALVTYYHEKSVNILAPWMSEYPKVRTYHSVDATFVRRHCVNYTPANRGRGLVSGALSFIYPLRWEIVRNKGIVGVHDLPHPGYHNHGVATHNYLRTLKDYKVHIATASSYHFSLRKIIESVACGATPVTNLPAYDVLPEIDGALVRVSDWINMRDLHEVVNEAERKWDPEERRMWAEKCLAFYDYRAIGARLDGLIQTHVSQVMEAVQCR